MTNYFRVVRATTQQKWSQQLPSDLGEYDLSDHHPCEWMVGELKGVTYNVQFLPSWIPGNETKGKVDVKEIKQAAHLIAEWLTRDTAGYDVICLQEVFDSTAAEILEYELAQKGFGATARLGGRFVGSPTSGGVRIYTRYPLNNEDEKALISDVTDKKGHIFSEKVDRLKRGDAFVDKGIKHVVVMKNNQRHHLMNVHLQSSYVHDPQKDGEVDLGHQHYVEVMLAQLIELKEYVTAQKKTGEILDTDHIVVCGDFNIPLHAEGELDAVSKRSEALFERAKILLGPGFHLIQQSEPDRKKGSEEKGWPKGSFDYETNTYLQADGVRMRADFDMVFSVDASNVRSKHPSLDVLVRHIQLELSHYVQKSTHGMSNQLSIKDQNQISMISSGLDEFISNPNVTTAKTLLTFAQSLALKKYNAIECALTGALVERFVTTPDKAAAIQLRFEHAMRHSRMVDHVHKEMASLRDAIQAGNVTQQDIEVFSLKLEKEPAINEALATLWKKSQLLRVEGYRTAPAIMATLHQALHTAANEYFKLNGTNVDDFRQACETAIDTAMPELKQHRGFYLALGTFLMVVGKTLGFPSWEEKGKLYLEFQTDSVRIVNLFKAAKEDIVPKSGDVGMQITKK